MIVRSEIYGLLLLAVALTQAHFPEYCAECEQEIWEQVPCRDVPTTTVPSVITTTSTISPPVTPPTTVGPGTTATPPPEATTQVYYSSTIAPPVNLPYDGIASLPAFKKCYCDCKLGCKDFCRKIAISGPKQQLTQISAVRDYAPGGQIEYSHVHQRKYFPKYAPSLPSYHREEAAPAAAVPYPLTYHEAPAPSSSVGNNINAPNYTLEELAHLLSNAYGNRKGYPPSPQPQPEPEPQPQPQHPVYYSPVVSKAKHVANYKVSASAVANGGIVKTQIKTPYVTEEHVVTSAPPPAYESSSPYPIAPPPPPPPPAIEPKPYSLPPSESKSYNLPPSEPKSYSLPPSETESYPMPQPVAESKAYAPPPESSSLQTKPGTTFDMAIDNYLKDYGYGNNAIGNNVIGPYANY
ncbi:extensin [Scaptodrosophila lebanonensis]|uniref:Extensin n=1 Tax=Drosophila lebanonensis TaxID=7225 RepID=A0A6J2TPV8_DROLE|nr:extensin [Scaptodrosophila lebanonensis]XP_030376993.1 extensin [Scaptodrosophila lebanonensis]